jgi:hypothetical protein
MCRRWSVLAAVSVHGLVGYEATELGTNDGPWAMNTLLFLGAFARLVVSGWATLCAY